MKTNRKNS